MPKFRKKPVVIEAWQIGGADVIAPQWLRDACADDKAWVNPDGSYGIYTLEGIHRGDVNDWIIQGVKGELYPCKPDIFAATYEPAE